MSRKVFKKLYPETSVGGYPRHSHKVVFYNRVRAILKSTDIVLDYGAGRGVSELHQDLYENQLANLSRCCAQIIGVDVDPAVHENPILNDAYLLDDSARIPLEDASVDLIVSWAVFEHIEKPEQVAKELDRVLKPGGWICAFTPNKWGDVAIAARVIPNRFHADVLEKIGMVGQPDSVRERQDVFPTFYRLNTKSAINHFFPENSYESYSYRTLGPPGYNAGSTIIARMMQLYDLFTPEPLSRMWHIFLRKRD